MKYVLQPVVVGWLGLPIDMVDALILTMARHEVGAGIILNMSDAGMLDFTQSIIAVVITTMFIPCIANIVAMFKEIGAKAGIIMTLSINVSSFILAGALRYVLVLFGG
jgi:ferrous iron transport protein B